MPQDRRGYADVDLVRGWEQECFQDSGLSGEETAHQSMTAVRTRVRKNPVNRSSHVTPLSIFRTPRPLQYATEKTAEATEEKGIGRRSHAG
jgi:hypothetical protein